LPGSITLYYATDEHKVTHIFKISRCSIVPKTVQIGEDILKTWVFELVMGRCRYFASVSVFGIGF